MYNYFVIIITDSKGAEMTSLIKIGNSQGIRIPKALIEQAHLQDALIELKVLDNGLLLQPQKATRQGWNEANVQKLAKKHAKEERALNEEFEGISKDWEF